jgi:flagellar hook assembly protein FlgD
MSLVDGSPVYRVHTADAEGWMTGSALVPRDSAAPRVWEVDDGAGAFSPDGDGTQDAIDVSVRLSEAATWTMRVVDGDGDTLGRSEGSSDTASIRWAPAAGSVRDGTYRWVLEATDGWANGPLRDDGNLTVDTVAPEVAVGGDADAVPQFSPNGDGAGDTVAFNVASSEPGSVTATIRDAGGETADHVALSVGTSAGTLAWDGRDGDGAYVPDGRYTLAFAARDRAGNHGPAVTRTVAVYAALAGTDASRDVFFPQDGDALASTTTFSFRLRSAATVSWSVVDASGAVVRTIKDAAALGAGTHAFAWNGRTDAGAMVPRGTYRTRVSATDGTFTATQAATVTADAFRITVSDTTPARGRKLTVTAASAETLDAAPRLRVWQPGISGWTVTIKKVDTRLYRITVTLRSSGTGTLKLRVTADDDGGRTQASYRYLPLH